MAPFCKGAALASADINLVKRFTAMPTKATPEWEV